MSWYAITVLVVVKWDYGYSGPVNWLVGANLRSVDGARDWTGLLDVLPAFEAVSL